MIALALVCCQAEPLRTLRDTEGRTFQARCAAQTPCSVIGPADGKGALQLYAPGRFIAICPAKNMPDPPDPRECRVLTCSGDTDCPPAIGLEHAACVNQLCIEPSQSLVTADAIMLCLADTGVGRDSQLQVERYAMALQCGKPCRVPAPCRQP